MCGRFTLAVPPLALVEAFPGFSVPEEIEPRYNIAPTQPVVVVTNKGDNQLEFAHWGLIPSWSKDAKIGNRMINARAETLSTKPSFRVAYRKRRCLIIADGFYEWRKDPGGKGKTPFYIRLKSGEPFAFAGLWETWKSPEGETIESCVIITTTPNELLAKVHDRMPVILPPEKYSDWLAEGDQSAEKLALLLKPYPADLMTAYPVSTFVNSPANDSPICIEPVELLTQPEIGVDGDESRSHEKR